MAIHQCIEQSPTMEGVYLLSPYMPECTHEEAYLQVRTKEDRVMSDDLVNLLPDLPDGTPHAQEWQLRKQTANRFCLDLAQSQTTTRILDLGCGNGWFSAKMTALPQVYVVGLDLNLPELQQAQKLFGSPKLTFCYGDILTGLFTPESFDRVVLNAACQYFPSIEKLVTVLFDVLTPTGEIHILDSPFYESQDVESARKRTQAYYQQLGHPEMAHYYFHHTFQELAPYSPIYKYRKASIWQRLLRQNRSQFPWVVIRKKRE
ncbi:class I SAM-dependent methyltransferase [Spirosoma foliorum]|uniref:Class I SAM-dependent methyltransferase n=1 Tax=Spirosoma foliorum TaxID=2710596 RepID=A0A7G5H623_9BACT|nr:class I SAM-dependent methyltransferase [Spirosoma foliorum]QMW06565.1 class I SAM-dependent methyltransferase [Spirosoma foliorum]